MSELTETVDWADAFGDAEPAEIVVAPPPTAVLAKPSVDERLRAIEDEVLEKHMSIVASAGMFPELDPTLDGPPDSWVAEYGPEEAMRRFRVARSAWLPQSDVPAGLLLSQKVVASMTKARALREAASGQGTTLNVQVAVFPAVQYERLEVPGGD